MPDSQEQPDIKPETCNMCVASVQTHTYHRSIGITCKLSGMKKDTASSPVKMQRHVMTSPIKNRVSKSETLTGNNTLSTLSDKECDFKGNDKANACESDHIPSASDSDGSMASASVLIDTFLSEKPKMYTGICDKWHSNILQFLFQNQASVQEILSLP
jgi:hypothetical protein